MFWLAGLALVVLYVVSLGVYRLYFSPIAKFPGPRLAALTTWYTAYYDIWLRGQYMWKVEELHKKYGPVVRINPHEIHVNDPYFIDTLYTGPAKKRDKFKWLGRAIVLPDSTVATLDHDLHRKRRAPLSPFFSKQSIRRLEPIIQTSLKALLTRLDEYRRNGVVFPASLAYQAVTCDIITTYSFGVSTDYTSAPDWNEAYFKAVEANFEMAHSFIHIPWLGPMLDSLPVPVTKKLMPGLGSLFDLQSQWTRQIEEMRKTGPEKTSRDTVFHGLLFNDLPESEKSTHRLRQEAQLLVLAGQDTTAKSLSAITFELLNNERVLLKLKEELEIALPDPEQLPTCAQVENLPYLTAVIQEGIRMHPGAIARMPRISPDQPLVYQDGTGYGSQQWIIPPGTPVSMSSTITHNNPDIFPNPQEFRPERWIENPRLDKHLLAFSKGTRMCLGINLAYQELYLVLAGVFRRHSMSKVCEKPFFHLELFDTVKERDVSAVADLIVPAPALHSQGVRMMVE